MIFKFLKVYKFSFSWAVLILILLLLPSKDMPKSELFFNNFDKIVHFALFCILYLLYYLDARISKQKLKFLIFFSIAVFFAIFSESLQLATDDRNFDILDILADTIGLAFGFIITKKLNYTKTKSL
jgi:VanZ family protein